MEAKHTATPWTWKKAQTLIHIFVAGRRIATIGNHHVKHTDDEANADFIVRACNAHDDLVDVLKNVLSDLEIAAHPHLHIEQIRAALAKAGAQ